jgi:hypothetical protein
MIFMVVGEITNGFYIAIAAAILYVPRIIASLIILLIGWFIGKAAGKIAAGVLDKIGLDDAVERTFLGDAIRRSGMTVKGLFDALVRWFIYIIFIMAAVNVLDIPVFSLLLQQFLLYIPQLLAGILILIVGLILVNFIMNWIQSWLRSSQVAFADIITTLLRAFFSLIIIVLALDEARIDTTIIYTFLTPLAWGLAVGLGLAIGIGIGWGSRDVVADYLREAKQKIGR